MNQYQPAAPEEKRCNAMLVVKFQARGQFLLSQMGKANNGPSCCIMTFAQMLSTLACIGAREHHMSYQSAQDVQPLQS